ncbi:Uncharacterised protein [Brucella suis]|nr:hypothetical protein C062_02514 [Brucella suis 92/29]ENR26955.1 hypothetical protein C965_02519 [Brucella suis CNGB 786]ENT26893.1 hypothetical protein B985_02344 [Brucella suis 01-5744]ENT34345.1 hypothetical protein C966_02513 [Brucella suis CNGB 247]KFJ26933.1 hypothetical protein DK66_515 [Brucella suis 1330]SPU73670.1 Uncharacterised protein [Brucella suis]
MIFYRIELVETGDEFKIFGNRQVFIKRKTLRHIADFTFDLQPLRPQVVAQYLPFPLIGRQQAAHDADRRRLAGTVRAEKADNLTFRHCHADVIHHGCLAEALHKPFYVNGIGHDRSPISHQDRHRQSAPAARAKRD